MIKNQIGIDELLDEFIVYIRSRSNDCRDNYNELGFAWGTDSLSGKILQWSVYYDT